MNPMHLGILSLPDTDPGNDVIRSDGTRGSAKSDTLKLGQVAVAVKFDIGTTGNFKYVNRAGRTRTIDVAKQMLGAWHLVQIQQVLSTGTTIADTAFELGWSGV